MNRSFSIMKQSVGQNIQDTSAETSNILGRYINDVYFDILRRINWDNVSHDYTFTTTQGVKDYILPSNFGKEMYVRNCKEYCMLDGMDTRRLAEKYGSQLGKEGPSRSYSILSRASDADPDSSTDVLELVGGGTIGAGSTVINLTSDGVDASTLEFVSDSSSDTTQSVYLRGYSGGVEYSEKVTLNGTNPVTSVREYTTIIALSKEATVGVVTITAHSGSLQVAKMAPEVIDYRVKCIRLQGVPDSEFEIELPYIINPLPLLQDSDIPLISVADIIEDGATAKAWRYKRQFAKAQEWERVYEKGINQLIWDKANQPNQVPLFNPKPYSREIY